MGILYGAGSSGGILARYDYTAKCHRSSRYNVKNLSECLKVRVLLYIFETYHKLI
jgi:hypothetical protein